MKFALHLSSWRLKCYYSQRNSMGTDIGNNKKNRQKAIFSIKKYLPIQSMISSSSKNSKHP